MERFHASTGLARLPYFLAVPCLSPQLQSILSLFVHREPDVPSNYRLNWPYINNLSKRLNSPCQKPLLRGQLTQLRTEFGRSKEEENRNQESGNQQAYEEESTPQLDASEEEEPNDPTTCEPEY